MRLLLAAMAVLPGALRAVELRERLVVREAPVPWPDSAVTPVLARDMAAGAGIFDYAPGPQGFGWPLVRTGQQPAYHFALLDSSGAVLNYSQIGSWPVWTQPVELAPPQPDPAAPTHSIACSRVSQKVCVAWVQTAGTPCRPAFYRISTDGGASWNNPTELPPPDAFGGDTLTSFHVSSLYPLYDSDDNLRIVAAVHPVVNDTGLVMPAEIWHWSAANVPEWTRIARAGCAPEHLAAPVGYNALYACRPSLSGTEDGFLFAVWEQFDSLNVEPRTNLLRARPFMAWSHVSELQWYGPWPLCETSTVSGRFPLLLYLPHPTDSLLLVYLADQVAGFYSLGQGQFTNNPLIAARYWFCVCGEPLFGGADTIGGTNFDMQCWGPAVQRVAVSADYGIHVAWVNSAATRPFPDLNMRYNFYDFGTGEWNWIDPDFMASGVNVFAERTALGSLDVDPLTQVALISGCSPPPLAIEEAPSAEGRAARTASIVRGSLALSREPSSPGLRPPSPSDGEGRGEDADSRQPVVLLDAAGRKVMELVPGV
ncbi:hypothetical protein FJY71_08900, partial [candidate division WOR-3 bacterium]|nr:hypothetical protein [candidate division WOR-3 bacterium]